MIKNREFYFRMCKEWSYMIDFNKDVRGFGVGDEINFLDD